MRAVVAAIALGVIVPRATRADPREDLPAPKAVLVAGAALSLSGALAFAMAARDAGRAADRARSYERQGEDLTLARDRGWLAWGCAGAAAALAIGAWLWPSADGGTQSRAAGRFALVPAGQGMLLHAAF